MLYFEPLFLRLLESPELTTDVTTLTLYLNALSQVPIAQWNSILEGIGACCYQFFAKEPFMYAPLPYRSKMDTPEEMTDQELLEAVESSLSPTPYRGKISIEDSRSQLIQRYLSKINE